ncbi:MAG: hypothetical protein R3A13_09915 [Bdellovibrionota bacterium]
MFTLRALSADNDGELRKLITLYKSVYKRSYPITQVYSLSFWKSHIGSKLISIGIYHADELIGHFALKNDPQTKHLKRLCVSAQKQLTKEQQNSLKLIFCQFIKDYCKKNNVRALYSFTYENEYIETDICLRSIGGIDSMVCPRYLPESHAKTFINGSLGGKKTSVLITVFAPKNLLNNYSISEISPHDSILNNILSELNFTKISSANKQSKLNPGLRSYINKLAQTHHYYLRPSALEEPAKLFNMLSKTGDDTVLAFLDIEDPLTGSFAENLDQLGFRMCGLSPLHSDQNSLVYFKDGIDELPSLEAFSSRSFDRLYSHMRNYKTGRPSLNQLEFKHAI